MSHILNIWPVKLFFLLYFIFWPAELNLLLVIVGFMLLTNNAKLDTNLGVALCFPSIIHALEHYPTDTCTPLKSLSQFCGASVLCVFVYV